LLNRVYVQRLLSLELKTPVVTGRSKSVLNRKVKVKVKVKSPSVGYGSWFGHTSTVYNKQSTFNAF
jgi:hypothetical protein